MRKHTTFDPWCLNLVTGLTLRAAQQNMRVWVKQHRKILQRRENLNLRILPAAVQNNDSLPFAALNGFHD